MEDSGRPAFGLLLRHFRLVAGLSQEELAERARMATESIGALERGARRSPYRETVALLANALGLSVEERAGFEYAAARPRSVRSRRLGESVAEATFELRMVPGLAAGERDAAALHNLPAEVSSLVGRDQVVTEIAAFIGSHRLVTLLGSGGVGKTRLALRVAANQLTGGLTAFGWRSWRRSGSRRW
jgi:transcriptional regulator with XRE-family HTH domain